MTGVSRTQHQMIESGLLPPKVMLEVVKTIMNLKLEILMSLPLLYRVRMMLLMWSLLEEVKVKRVWVCQMQTVDINKMEKADEKTTRI